MLNRITLVSFTTIYMMHRTIKTKNVIEGKRQETGRRGEDVSRYWMTLRNVLFKRIWTSHRRDYVMVVAMVIVMIMTTAMMMMMMRDDDYDHSAFFFFITPSSETTQ